MPDALSRDAAGEEHEQSWTVEVSFFQSLRESDEEMRVGVKSSS